MSFHQRPHYFCKEYFGTLKIFVRFIVVWLLWIGLLSACGVNTPTTLEFELIEEGDSLNGRSFTYETQGIAYEGKEPNILVIASIESISSPGLNIRFPPDLQAKLLGVDYDEKLVVVIFRGAMGDIFQSPLITLESVSWNGRDEVIIKVVFRDTSKDTIALPAISSPYYVAAVDKPVVEGQDVRFILQSGGEVVAEQTIYFP